MNQPQHVLQALALLIQKHGQRIDGGHEVYIPDEVLAALSPHGQIQEQRHTGKPGICVRYLHNSTVEGVIIDGGLTKTDSTIPEPTGGTNQSS
jgi:hypothetical protein